ncbi:MAG: hypothetical protein RL693_1580 [Verrucomicrobiota bacterium]|jgi:predicted RND superfamily exporter protein
MPRSRIIVLLVCAAALVVLGLSRLRLDADILSTLPPSLPEVEGLRLLRDAFTGGDELVIGLEAADSDAAQAAVSSLNEHLKKSPLVREVESAGTWEKPEAAGALLAWAVMNASPDKVSALRQHLEAGQIEAHLEQVVNTLASSPDPAVVQRWSYDPLGLLECIDMESLGSVQDSGFDTASADGTFRLMFLAPPQKFTGYKEAALWLRQLRSEIENWRSADKSRAELTFYFTGEPAFLAETGEGIERDMKSTIGITEVLIAILFWVMFRRLKPLIWIQLLVALILLLTLALSGLFLGSVSVMSFGFAAIVLGIVVDYAVLILQESMDHPQLDATVLRRRAMPGILAGACTTATVFLSLLFSGLPGLADLGVLVAVGVIVGLVVMVVLVPLIVVKKNTVQTERKPAPMIPVNHGLAVVSTVVLVAGVGLILTVKGLPVYQSGSGALRPSQSQATAAWDRVQQRLGKEHQASVPLLVTGQADKLREHAITVRTVLNEARSADEILHASVPVALLANPEAQQANRSDLAWFVNEQAHLREALLKAGFTEDSMRLFQSVAAVWGRALQKAGPLQAKDSEASRVLGRFLGSVEHSSPASEKAGRNVMLCSVTLAGEPGTPDAARLQALQERLNPLPDVHLTGWESLGTALSKLVRGEILRLTVPLILVLAIMLTLTFRNVRDIVLSVFLLSLGIAALMATMSLLGQKWNLASLAALPLLLGTGIDYGIHIMLAMARENNDIRKVRMSTGRAVFFSGATTVIGFSSLMFAGNQGVASLGTACCIGTLWILLFVLWLLPHWRVWICRGKS